MANKKSEQIQRVIDDVRSRLDLSLKNATKSTENWKSLLRTISHSYGYSFYDNLLINQVMPEATNLHNITWWNKRFRVVEDYRNKVSVQLLDNYDRGIQANIVNLYDISETTFVPNLAGAYISFKEWNRGVQHTKVVFDCFLKDGEKSTPTLNGAFVENLGGVAKSELALSEKITLRIPTAVFDYEKKNKNLSDILTAYATQNNLTLNAELKREIWNKYNRLVSNSCDYAILNRLDLDTSSLEDKFYLEDLEYLRDYGLLNCVGNAICDVVKTYLKTVANKITGFDTWVENKCEEEISKGGVIVEKDGVKTIERELDEPEYENGRSFTTTDTTTGESTTWHLRTNNKSIEDSKTIIGTDISVLHDDEEEKDRKTNSVSLDDLSSEELDDYYLALEPRKAPNIDERKSYIPMSHDNLHQLYIRNIMFYALAKTGYKQDISTLFIAGADYDNEDMLTHIQTAFDNDTVEFTINGEKFTYTAYKEGVLFESREQDRETFVEWKNISETLQAMTVFGELQSLTVPEQLKAVTRTEEQFKNAHFEIPEEVVNYVLRTSLKNKNGTDSAKYEVYEYWKESKPSVSEMAVFLRAIYFDTNDNRTIEFPLGKGTHSAFYNRGLLIKESIGLDNRQISDSFTWNEIAKKVIGLLESEKYLTSKELNVGYDKYLYEKGAKKALETLRYEIKDVVDKAAHSFGFTKMESLAFRKENIIFSLFWEKVEEVTTYYNEKKDNLESSRATVLNCLKELFDTVANPEIKNEISAVCEKLGGEKLISRAIAKKEPVTTEEDFFYEYYVGTRVYLGGIEYEISYFDDEIVKLFDVDYKISTREMSRSDFDKALSEEKLDNFLRVYTSNPKVSFKEQYYAAYSLSNGKYIEIGKQPIEEDRPNEWLLMLYSKDLMLEESYEVDADSLYTALQYALDYFCDRKVTTTELVYSDFQQRVEEAERAYIKAQKQIQELPPVTPLQESVYELSVFEYPEKTVYADISKCDTTFYNEETGKTETYKWVCDLYNADYGNIGTPIYLSDSCNSIEQALDEVYTKFGGAFENVLAEPKRIERSDFHNFAFGDDVSTEKRSLTDLSAEVYHFLYLNGFDDFNSETGEHSIAFRDIEKDILAGNTEKIISFLSENKALDKNNRIDYWIERISRYTILAKETGRFDCEVGTVFFGAWDSHKIIEVNENNVIAKRLSNKCTRIIARTDFDEYLLRSKDNAYIDTTSEDYHKGIPLKLLYASVCETAIQAFKECYANDYEKVRHFKTGTDGKKINDEIVNLVNKIIRAAYPKEKDFFLDNGINRFIADDIIDFAECPTRDDFEYGFEYSDDVNKAIWGISDYSYDEYKNKPFRIDYLSNVYRRLFTATYKELAEIYTGWFRKLALNNYSDEEKAKIDELIYRCFEDCIKNKYPAYGKALTSEQTEELVNDVIGKAQSADRFAYQDVFDRKSAEWTKEPEFVKIYLSSSEETKENSVIIEATEVAEVSEEKETEETEKAESVPLLESEAHENEIKNEKSNGMVI